MEPDGYLCTILFWLLCLRFFLALLLYCLSQHPLYPPLRYVMGRPLYSGFEACTQLKVSTRRLCLFPCCPHDKFSQVPAERLPYAHRSHTELLSNATR